MYNANLYSVEQYYNTDKFTVRLNGKVLESELSLETARNLVESKIEEKDDYKELMNDQKTLMTGPEFKEARIKTREQNAQAAQNDKSWYYQDAYGNTVCGNGVQMKVDKPSDNVPCMVTNEFIIQRGILKNKELEKELFKDLK